LGKTLSVTGSVSSIDKGRSNDVQIMLVPSAGESFMSVRCYFSDETQIAGLANVRAGDTLRITGNCTSSGTLEIVLQKCRL
jgi:hypothetical protein